MATTGKASASSDTKSSRSDSDTSRAGLPSGSTRWSGEPNRALRKGSPRKIRKVTAATVTTSGRRMTVVATRCQKPSPTSGVARWRKTRHLSTRVPSTASRAGRLTSEASIATRITPMPA